MTIFNRASFLERLLYSYLLLTLAWGIGVPAFGQDPTVFRHLLKKDGLSQSSVFSITQDADGFMWFGTRDGLNKYDGYQFTVYRQSPLQSGSLVSNDVRVLYIDPVDSSLWAGTLDGLSHYDTQVDTFQNFSTEHGLSSSSIRSILRDMEGRLWVATANGLNLFLPQENRFEFVPIDPLPGETVEVNAMVEDKMGDFWLGTSVGLFLLQIDDKDQISWKAILQAEQSQFPLMDYRVKVLMLDQEQKLWIGTETGGLYLWNQENKKLKSYQHHPDEPNSLSNNNVRSLTMGPDGTVWVGTFVGLNKYLPELNAFKRFEKEELDPGSLSNSSVRSVFFDRRDALWIGTYHGGVNYYDPGLSRFKNYEAQADRNTLSHNVVSSFVEDEKENLWIGTEGGGLNYFDRKTESFHYFQPKPEDPNSLSGNNVKTLLKDGQDLWIGIFRAGVNRFDISTKTFQRYLNDPNNENSLSDNDVYALLKEQHYLWILTYGGGLNVLDLKQNQFNIFKNQADDTTSISSNLGRVLLKDSRHQIWVGTENGLDLIKRKRPLDFNLQFQNVLPNVEVYALFEDKSGVLWVGTFSDGLFALNPEDGSYQQYTVADGLPGHTILGIQQDQSGQLWLSTNNGISKFEIGAERFTNYNYSNGLNNLEFNFNAHYKTRSGELIFGGNKGFTLFQPEAITPNDSQPLLVFTDLKVSNEKVLPNDERKLLTRVLNQTKSLRFRYNEANFTLGFAALDYFNPTTNQYAYRLEGLDNDWIYKTGETEVSYTIQKAGTYTFHLKGANSDGVWNTEERQLKIQVLPPPWQTPWAYLIYAILISSAIYGIGRLLRLQQVLQVEKLAKKQQRELNEMKLRFFTNVTHEFRTPLTLMLGPLEDLVRKFKGDTAEGQLVSVKRNAQRLLNLVNQILVFRKLETDHEQMHVRPANMVSMLFEVYLSFEESARLRGIQYEFVSSSEEIQTWFDHDKMEGVFFNLLSNAFKFTPNSGQVLVNIKEEGKDILISVQDNGVGIRKEGQEQIFQRFYEKATGEQSMLKGSGIGLSLSKQMVNLHHGKIWVESEEGKGATFFVSLPKGKAHFEEQEIESLTQVNSKGKQPKHFIIPAAASISELSNSKATKQASKILIVEDNPEVLDYIRGIFQKEYQVITARNGQEGLEQAKQHNPDLVLSDVMMPEMDGTTLCKHLKTNLKTSHIPVILLTARAAQVFVEEGLQIGADDYLTKPFHKEELLLRVRNLIQTRKMMREKFIRVMNFEPKEIVVTSADENFLKNALEVAEKHMDNTRFNAEQFAYELAVSRPLLFTKMKALTNQTPNNFLKNLRMKRAAQLLEQQKLNVSEVAYKVGYRDTRYFSKCFQAQYGKTPSEYMKALL